MHSNSLRDRHCQGVVTSNICYHYVDPVLLPVNTNQLAGGNNNQSAEKLLQLMEKITITSTGVVTHKNCEQFREDGERPHWECGQKVVVQEEHLQQKGLSQIIFHNDGHWTNLSLRDLLIHADGLSSKVVLYKSSGFLVFFNEQMISHLQRGEVVKSLQLNV